MVAEPLQVQVGQPVPAALVVKVIGERDEQGVFVYGEAGDMVDELS
eukprot:gene4423-8536_t